MKNLVLIVIVISAVTFGTFAFRSSTELQNIKSQLPTKGVPVKEVGRTPVVLRPPVSTSGALLYENTDMGVSMYVPKSWFPDTDSGNFNEYDYLTGFSRDSGGIFIGEMSREKLNLWSARMAEGNHPTVGDPASEAWVNSGVLNAPIGSSCEKAIPELYPNKCRIVLLGDKKFLRVEKISLGLTRISYRTIFPDQNSWFRAEIIFYPDVQQNTLELEAALATLHFD